MDFSFVHNIKVITTYGAFVGTNGKVQWELETRLRTKLYVQVRVRSGWRRRVERVRGKGEEMMHPVVVGMQVEEKKNDEREREKEIYIYRI